LKISAHAGAFVAYWTFFILGQGIFPILFFSGICITLYLFGNRVSDVWLRTIGIALLSVAFAPRSSHPPRVQRLLPEGIGGLIGISAPASSAPTANALVRASSSPAPSSSACLLAADDLVVRVPGFRRLRHLHRQSPEHPADQSSSFPPLPGFDQLAGERAGERHPA